MAKKITQPSHENLSVKSAVHTFDVTEKTVIMRQQS